MLHATRENKCAALSLVRVDGEAGLAATHRVRGTAKFGSFIRTLGLVRVDGEAAFATLTHGRAMLGAGGTRFGRTVRATAFVGRALGFVRVDGVVGLTCLAHDRAILGTGSTSFWRTVRATAFVGRALP